MDLNPLAGESNFYFTARPAEYTIHFKSYIGFLTWTTKVPKLGVFFLNAACPG
jgi:hypothetical protein